MKCEALVYLLNWRLVYFIMGWKYPKCDYSQQWTQPRNSADWNIPPNYITLLT